MVIGKTVRTAWYAVVEGKRERMVPCWKKVPGCITHKANGMYRGRPGQERTVRSRDLTTSTNSLDDKSARYQTHRDFTGQTSTQTSRLGKLSASEYMEHAALRKHA